MKRAYADRSTYLGDTDFVSVPLKGLINKNYAKSLLKEISLKEVTSSKDIGSGNPLPYESPDTTHFSVMDDKGNVVSNTYTLNFSYGSGILFGGLLSIGSFLLHQERGGWIGLGVASICGLLLSKTRVNTYTVAIR